MTGNKKIPDFKNYEEMSEFWDTHSLADYWDQTEPAKLEISKNARHHYLVSVDKELLKRIQKMANKRGLSTEILVNLLIEQRLQEIDEPA
ncbi:MAG: hypothetical protein A2161_03790 [Candidatus Schekmanbacteria bacterium RBG_13_48_7]|uniref:CopG antitoxin of type II toxin-antitoxin system n=1 Tax=Candidatus Schekmanbacteria bacterium RBG_13_48_7 TaxID=1817878 RepID=A0A1F7S6X5_9BACT|nr:MAG: hypothetical protein A2161_03790 [Candidatus Schekmanbacteria bacterium RBG_13_48_7]